MAETAVALFRSPAIAEVVVKEIEGLGFPKKEVQTLEEPGVFPVSGVMSFARLDFEVELRRELSRIGASKSDVDAYMRGLQRGGALVLASGSDNTVRKAAAVMNSQGALRVEEDGGAQPELPEVDLNPVAPTSDAASSGARLFVW